MPLTLSVRIVERQAGIAPPPLRLFRRGAVIGRSPSADWVLPDERNAVSSRHCEIAFRDGAYLIADSSTNGTYVNGQRMAAPHRMSDGDVLNVGPYELIVQLVAEDTLAPPTGSVPQALRPPPMPTAFPAGASPGAAAVDHLLRHAGLRRADVAAGDAEVLAGAGALLSQAVSGTRTLLAGRARARSELGAPADTGEAGNPLKRQGTDEEALAALLAAPGADKHAADAFADLQAHQLATLKTMQGAMKATLDRLSPAAIRGKVGAKGGEAALWQEYERAFTASGDDAFIEVFAREFRTAYEALAKRR